MVLSHGLGTAQVKGVGEVEISIALSAGEEGAVQPMDVIFTPEGTEDAYIVTMASIFERVLSHLAPAKAQETNDGTMARANHPTIDAELRAVIDAWLNAKEDIERAEERVTLAEAQKAAATRGKPWIVSTLEELVAKRNEIRRADMAVDDAKHALAALKEAQRQRENTIKGVLGSDAWYAYRDDLYIGVQRTNWGLGDSKILACNPKAGQLPRLYIHCT